MKVNNIVDVKVELTDQQKYISDELTHTVVFVRSYPSVVECIKDIVELQKEYDFVHVVVNSLAQSEYFPSHHYGHYDIDGEWVEYGGFSRGGHGVIYRVEHKIEETKSLDLSRLVLLYNEDITKGLYLQHFGKTVSGLWV